MQPPELTFLNSLFPKPFTWVKLDILWKNNIADTNQKEMVEKANAQLKNLASKISLTHNPPIFQKFADKRRARAPRTSWRTGETIPAFIPDRSAPIKYHICIHPTDLLNLYLENERNLFKEKLEKEIRSQTSDSEFKINLELKKVIDEATEAHIDSLRKKLEERDNKNYPRPR